MKILFTGGGTGGHFYPIIAIAEEINDITRREKMLPPEMYFFSPAPYNEGLLYDNNITFKKTSAGKLRRYFSIMNFFDLFKTGWGMLKSVWDIFLLYPDVVFGKGGYASFPAIFAARILRIPVVIHESDTVPGKTNRWAAKFAKKIAVSYPEAAKHFPKEKVAHTGHPVRKNINLALSTNAFEYLKLKKELPVIFTIGGSLGSRKINDALEETLPHLLKKYQVIHQTGKANKVEVQRTVDVILAQNENRENYKMYDYMDDLEIRSAAGAARIIVSRAGSLIFEIASWGVPSIIIPISESNANHQVKNAYAYARTGAASVIEEANLTGNILYAEIERISNNPELYEKMKKATETFVNLNAAKLIAEEILKIALKHDIE